MGFLERGFLRRGFLSWELLEVRLGFPPQRIDARALGHTSAYERSVAAPSCFATGKPRFGTSERGPHSMAVTTY